MKHDENAFPGEKSFDRKTFMRLIGYAKPYVFLLSVTFALLIAAAASDLLRPYLVKVAIDDHISNEGRVYYRVEASQGAAEGVEIGGEIYSDEYVEGAVSFRIDEDSMTLFPLADGGGLPVPVEEHEIDALNKLEKRGLIRVSIIFLCVLLASSVFNYIQVIMLNHVGQSIIYNMRKELFDHVQSLPLSYFDRNPVGKIVTRISNYMNNINQMFTQVLLTFFKDMVIILGTIFIMLRMNWRIALIAFSTLPVVLAAAFFFRRKAKEAHREVKARLSSLNTFFNESVKGMEIIRAFAKQDEVYGDFEKINHAHYQANLRELKIFAVFRPSMDMIYTVALSLLIWFGGRDVIRGKLEFGVLFAFINYIQQMYRPIFDLSEKFNILQSAGAASEKVFDLLDEDISIENPQNPVTKDTLEGSIEFDHVWFSYDDEWILRDVSFKIEKGETVALLGATGSGKTTVTNLITRLYDIQKGDIRVDGISIRDFNKKSLRRCIGLVRQEIFIFKGTVSYNISLGDESLDREKIEQAASDVHVDRFVNSYEEGFDRILNESGSILSEGERQLLSFARAVANDPCILILDEATSNVDSETEGYIQDAMNRLTENRTTVIVAHRLSTIRKADRIFVLHKGRLEESGSHKDLMAKEGLYYDLYRMQYGLND